MSVPRYLLPPRGRPRYHYVDDGGLGLYSAPQTQSSFGLPQLAVTGASAVATGGASLIPQALAGVASALASIFGGSDPKKDLERKARIDSYYNAAMAGEAEGEARLRCYAGEETPLMLQLAIGDGNQATGPLCAGYNNSGQGRAAGSAVAYRYAQAKLAEFKARKLLGAAGGWAISESNVPTTIAGTLGRAMSNPMTWAALGLAGFLVLRKGRR